MSIIFALNKQKLPSIAHQVLTCTQVQYILHTHCQNIRAILITRFFISRLQLDKYSQVLNLLLTQVFYITPKPREPRTVCLSSTLHMMVFGTYTYILCIQQLHTTLYVVEVYSLLRLINSLKYIYRSPSDTTT